MTRSTRNRRPARAAAAKNTPITPRAVLLAGVGAVAIARRQAVQAADALAALPGTLGAKACAFADEARERAFRARKLAKARLAPVQKQVAQVAAQAEAEFEARVAPLLARFGATPARKPRRAAAPRKRPVAKRPAAKRARRA